ncbi:oligopeptide transport system substrate-binding protein [Borreliella japonica]|uniref:Oligopeptide transport system substrate-binding protein n=1 Tax=Borreliella japonica TaxID=34095 RepID=A0A1G4PIB4_BORJA|nr:peptide ABC transporter substrate-binding protein [Borreliella japonica]WKC88940.1 peptide ABC transporter substrate-binding protein [Borreliella japonica]SCW31819.1 oligopeptide transport system substrate-binding protein [Borreliella japonica]
MKLQKILFSIIFFLTFLCCNNEEKTEGVSFKISLGSEPSSLDPQLSDDNISSKMIDTMFRGLVTGDPNTGGNKPGLAKNWDISPDGTVYTFTLREQITWSDGVAITAEGIRKSYLRILNKETGSKYVEMVKSAIKNGQKYFDEQVSDSELGIRAIDERTLEITLESPKPYFIDMLVHQSFIPIPIHVTEKYGQSWTNPENMVTSGPFKLKERVPNEKYVLEKNDKYYNSSEVEVQNIAFYTTNDSSTAYKMYENEELDAIFGSIPPDLIRDLKLRSDYYSSAVNAVYFYAFNTHIKPLDNVKVRKALTLAIDRETLAYKVLDNGTTPTRRATPNFSSYSYSKNLELFNPEVAKTLLVEAGYPNGNGFPILKLKYNTSEANKKICEFIQNQWKKNLNIDVELENEEWTTYLNTRSNGNYEIARAGWVGDYADPSTFLSIFTQGYTQFSSHNYSNLEYDELIKKSDLELDPIKRQDILRQAEEIIIEKDFPIAPIYIYGNSYLFRNDKWTGWNTNISERFDLSQLKLKNK